jgi:fumarate reductase subunit C
LNEARLYLLQRLSAMILAPFVLVHLGLVIYAVRGGLSAAEILSRTQGSLFWVLFYGLFVVAVAVHAPIGLRNVLREWTPWRGHSLDWAMLGFAGLLTALGLRAVAAVVL